MIQPTIGRVVLYRPTGVDGPTYPALITGVHNDHLINVGGFATNGLPFADTGVPLVQGDGSDGDASEGQPFAEWMPYQKGQAAKTEALEATLATETKTYTDGTSATGPAPLPDLSPDQQDAAAAQQSPDAA